MSISFVVERVMSRMSSGYGYPSLIAGGLCVRPAQVSFVVWEN